MDEANQLMGALKFLLTRDDANDFLYLIGIDENTVYRIPVYNIVSIELSKGEK